MAGLGDLRARVAAEVAGPGDPPYEDRRAVFDARVDRRPTAIVSCRSAEDIAGALAFAAERGLRVAVRAGGTTAGAVLDDGLVLDLAAMDAVTVDVESRTAHVAGGATWLAFDAATQLHGLAATGARVSRLGVAGVVLSGGSGWLERTLGPPCAGLAGAQVLLADGRTVETADPGHADLLWALRGDGAGLGVVTRMDLALHPVGPVLLCGFLTFARVRAGEIARAYRDLMAQAPDQVGGGMMLFAGRGGACTVAFCHAGEPAEAERAVAPLRALGPSLDAVMPNEYRAFQAMTDLQNPWGMRTYARSGVLDELRDEAIDAALAAAHAPAAALSHLLLRPLGGALDRLDAATTGAPTPVGGWAYECRSLWPPLPTLDAGNIAWADAVAGALTPFHAEVDAGAERRRAERLAQVRRRYDPDARFMRRGA